MRFAFVGGKAGPWRVLSVTAVRGASLTPVTHLDLYPVAAGKLSPCGEWQLEGLISNLRYATRSEVANLKAAQEGLGRPAARRAALIPIKKSREWWSLAQDERRAIFEETSHHTAIGLTYLPAVARQLYHSRDIGQPFDFLTWFEYPPEHAEAFEDLVARLRATEEWAYVEREVDLRLERR
jgi:chlorite dismutase